MKTPISPLNVILYIGVGAAIVGFAASAIPALLGFAVATKTAGLTGAVVGALVGFFIGLNRRFR